MGVVAELPESRLPQADLSEAERARAAGDLDAALAAFDRVLASEPRNADARAGKGAVLRAKGEPREALIALLEALHLAPHHQEARLELALALREAGRHEEARTLYGLLLKDPAAPAQAWHGLAVLLLSEGKLAVAEAALRRAIAIAPERIEARLHLADLLSRREDLAGALDLYHDILAIEPACVEAHAGLGQVLIGLGRLGEAEDQLERALVMDAENPVAHLARARLNLLDGNLPAAWEDLEYRWPFLGRQRPEVAGTAWNGSDDLVGQTILLWAEQGLAEIIHQLRFVPLVAKKGAHVILGVPAPLAALAATVEGVAQVVPSGQRLPAGTTIHYNASLADLPRLFGTRLAQAPHAPYLSVPTGHRPKITAPATALLKVGLVWAGPRGAWSVPFAQLAPLLGMAGIAVFGLQIGNRARDIAELAHPALITDLSPTISDYADLAGRMAEMDVVITVDGPSAHLSGALGVPTFVLLPQAPDWRWMLERDDSPWYPSARLFRQNRSDNWNGPVQRACKALRELMTEERARRETLGRAESGDKAAARAFLAAHLQPGDLLVDVGSGDGTFALDAAACEDVRVLAIEARAAEAEILADTVAISGAEEVVEVIHAALCAEAGPVVVAKVPRAGRTVFPLPAWVAADRVSTTLDALLSERPALEDRRLVLRLGAKGSEDDALAGLSAEPALVIFTHRAGSAIADCLIDGGYALYRFPGTVSAGPVVEFSGQDGIVLALAPGLAPAAIYGDTADTASPAAMAAARAEGARLAADGAKALMAGQVNLAGKLLARALAADPTNASANANLGSLLRRIGRGDAAAACWGRALACGAGAAVHANAGNQLRELGYYLAAEAEYVAALEREPNNPAFLYGFGLLERERGRAKEAVGLFERAEQLAPGTVPRKELAAALLKSGNLARGMAEMAHRAPAALAPVAAPVWDGGRLDARTILVRDENDAIDTLMLARFIPQVARHGGLVVVECVPDVARLMAGMPGVEQVITRGEPLPACDVQVNLPDVPRLIGTTSRTTPPRDVPYIHLPDELAPHVFAADKRLRVGISWSGRAADRAVPLPVLLRLAADPSITLVSLQRGERADDLAATGANVFVENLGVACEDLAASAALIAGLDLMVTTDTAEAHLAGAMGKPVWVLLPQTCDWRWVDGRDDSVWYPTMRVFRQSSDATWDRAITRIAEAAGAMAAGKRARG